MNSFYEVTFDTKRGGFRSWVIHVTASSQKDARRQAETMWAQRSNAHMFHVSARRLKDTEEYLWHWFHSLTA